MPSPFPGMDPYLESPTYWEGFHQLLISSMTGLINDALPPELVARVGEHVYVLEPDNKIVPDVTILPRPAPHPSMSGRTATLEPVAEQGVLVRLVDKPLLISMISEEVREAYIDIIAVREGERVVTTIELLSPFNKRTGSGAEEYRRKQRQILASSAHLVEIDLLRGGKHSVAAAKSYISTQRSSYDYLVCVHESGSGSLYQVWAFGLRDALPTVQLPLTEKHGEVPLDLQAVFAHTVRQGAYDRSVNYSIVLDPPLSATDAAWLDTLLREKGLR